MTPFFQATRRSLTYQFTIIAPLLCPPFSNFRKNFNFQPCFGQNFSSQDANFPNFRSLGTSFFKENPLPRPYFWKPVWHTPTKKKLSAPPGSQTFQNEGAARGLGGADRDSASDGGAQAPSPPVYAPGQLLDLTKSNKIQLKLLGEGCKGTPRRIMLCSFDVFKKSVVVKVSVTLWEIWSKI